MKLTTIKADDEFKNYISNGKSVIMIFKDGCPFCEKAHPWLEEFVQEFDNKNIAQVNKEDIPKIMDVFQVKMYPTFVAINNGVVEDTFFGDTVYDKVRDFVVKHI